MIDFNATLVAIREYRETIVLDLRAEDQVSATMAGVCKNVIAGSLYSFTEDSEDAFSRSFIGWTQARSLLRLA